MSLIADLNQSVQIRHKSPVTKGTKGKVGEARERRDRCNTMRNLIEGKTSGVFVETVRENS